MTHRPAPADAAALIRSYLSEHEESAWLTLLEVHAALTRSLDRALTDQHGISMRSFDVLMRIAHDPAGETTISDLVHGAGVGQSQVSRIVMDLERRGLVERRSKPDDARATAVAMTNAGFELLAQAAPAYLQVLRARLFDHLEPGEAEALAQALGRALPPAPE